MTVLTRRREINDRFDKKERLKAQGRPLCGREGGLLRREEALLPC